MFYLWLENLLDVNYETGCIAANGHTLKTFFGLQNPAHPSGIQCMLWDQVGEWRPPVLETRGA